MKPLRDQPIQRKVTTVILIASTVTLLLATTTMVAAQWFRTRALTAHDLLIQGRILAANSTAAILFNDARTANELLASLQVKPHLVHAILQREDGSTLGEFTLPPHDHPRTVPHLVGGVGLLDGLMIVVEPVVLDGKQRGTLQLEFDFGAMQWEIITPFIGLSALILAASLILALVLSAKLQRLISVPIIRLSQTAGRIAAHNDYSVRAECAGSDEIGGLTTAFNRMLDRIQESDDALRKAHRELGAQMAERQRLNHELVEASRRAGMAEVATGVLHNVGNVLNSVNVSATLIRDTLKASELAQLAQVVRLLDEHRPDLPHFLLEDPRGRLVVAFLGQLAAQLGREHTNLETEISALSLNIEHIKEIVARQQTFARTSGVLEQVSPTELVGHALGIHQASIQRHGVQVTREFAEALPTFTADRHNIIQILTNFVANAIHAIKPNPLDRRVITVQVARRAPDRIAFSVADNGVGIAPENLPRIFRLGFTTRQDGHGFGLHAGALAAKSLGGSLEVRSDGPGKGAVFTLVLPVKSPELPARAG